MYREHESFVAPSDPDVKIWRYMNTDKFLDLITTKSLFFASSDRLGDPMEGSYTKGDVDFMKEHHLSPKTDLVLSSLAKSPIF